MTQENMLARYGILRELGRGATGVVYAARDRQTGAVVALKRLDPALSGKSGANFAERFLKHARSARLLKHRNIVEIRDAGEVGGTVYVAMEMLEGESLRKILDNGPLPIARATRIAHDIACGLAHAHLEGVVHGGVRPSNVVVLRSGAVKITDFSGGQLGQLALLSGAPAGCLSYMSPEQLRGEPVDHRCDMFSLGALFYEMLAHRPPFAGSSAKEIMENILHAKPPPPSELNPHAPRALDAIVLGMLAAQPAARTPGAPIFLRELQRIEEGLGLGSGASAGAGEPPASVPQAAPEPKPQTPDRDASGEAFDYHKAMALMERESRRERTSGSRPAMFAAFALMLAVLGIGVAGFLHYSSHPGQWSIAAARVQEALASVLAASRPAAPPPVAEAPQELPPAPVAPQASLPPAVDDPQPPKPLAAEPGPPAKVESVVARVPEQPAPPAAAPAQQPPQATQPAAKVPEQQPGGTARLILAVSPRGELYIDGEHHGTTPPITTFDLEPGMHRIEIRSGSRTPYLTYMTVQAGDVRRIRYDFDTRRAVHPPATASWQNRIRAAR